MVIRFKIQQCGVQRTEHVFVFKNSPCYLHTKNLPSTIDVKGAVKAEIKSQTCFCGPLQRDLNYAPNKLVVNL